MSEGLMAQHNGVRGAGERVEAILGELTTAANQRVAAAAEELVRVLVDLYGAGLARVMEIVAADEQAGPRLSAALADDPLVESLLLVHDLHPVDVDTRIQRALDRVRPYLGSHAGGVEYRGIDEAGVVHMKLEGSCHGCPSSTVTVRLAIETAVREAAPEVTGVEVEGQIEVPAAGPPLLQIGRRPPSQAPVRVATEVDTVDSDGWAVLPAPTGATPKLFLLGGVPVLVCGVDGTLYAYRDACPECGSSLSSGRLAGSVLDCPDCGRCYDVRLAGVGLTDPARHLDPLPLLVGDEGIRIAVGAGTVH
jgi:Fe-S cluster biogenesis protein NfuA/nitrite reductase/ring-hydroxylating ferredoxin subunit